MLQKPGTADSLQVQFELQHSPPVSIRMLDAVLRQGFTTLFFLSYLDAEVGIDGEADWEGMFAWGEKEGSMWRSEKGISYDYKAVGGKAL